jgi:hypothetical protein
MRLFLTVSVLALVVLFILGAGCTASAPARNDTPPAGSPVSLSITSDITRYTPMMSSTVGIGLTPQVSGTLPPDYLVYTWKTDYGHFLGWNAPGYMVGDLGTTFATGNGTKVYWTYLGENESGGRPPVHVTLDLVDRATGATLGHAERVIGWDAKNDTAVIG